jgi:hypothetical protein
LENVLGDSNPDFEWLEQADGRAQNRTAGSATSHALLAGAKVGEAVFKSSGRLSLDCGKVLGGSVGQLQFGLTVGQGVEEAWECYFYYLEPKRWRTVSPSSEELMTVGRCAGMFHLGLCVDWS